MAKQPAPEFSPYRAVTPASQLTDFYRQPNILQVPDSGLGQIAEALQGLSPTLMDAISDQAEIENKEQTEQGKIDATKLTPEQSREALKGNFSELEKNGTIPKGASPFRLAGMQTSLGKRAVEITLKETLNNNLQRMSDPYSNEDISEFVQNEFLTVTEGMGFYGQQAATASLDNVERNFLSQVTLLRNSKRVEQNKMDLSSDVMGALQLDPPEEFTPNDEGMNPQAIGWYTNALQTRANEYYNTTGESGREEIMNGIIAATKAAALDGDLEKAEMIMTAGQEVKFGDRKLIEDKRIEFAQLEDSVGKLVKSYEDTEYNNQIRKRNKDNFEVEKLVNDFVVELGEDFRGTNIRDMQEDIKARLVETGMDEDSARRSSVEVMKQLEADQRKVPPTVEELNELSDIIYNDDLSASAKREALNAFRGAIDPKVLAQHMDYINRTENSAKNYGELSTRVSQIIHNKRDELALFITNNEDLDEIEEQNVKSQFGLEIQKIIEDLSFNTELTLQERRDEFSNQVQELSDKYQKDLAGDPDVEGVTPVIQTGVFRSRERENEVSGQAEPRGMIQPNTWWDSDAANYLITLQGVEAWFEQTPKQKEEARAKVYGASKTRLQEISDWRRGAAFDDSIDSMGPMKRREVGNFAFGMGPEKNEELRLRAVVGFSLEEIKKSKTENNVDIPNEWLNPKHSILVPEMDSVTQFKEFYKSEEGQAAIREIMKTVPDKYRFGTDEKDFDRFCQQQITLLIKYREPSTGGN